jgi:HAD superfamily hydrolase (TIGR01509 family)
MTLQSSSFDFRNIRGLLFDHDGTLAESEPLQAQAWRQLFQELGVTASAQDILQRSIGKPAPLILETILNLHRPHWRDEGLDPVSLAHRKNDFYLELAHTELRPYPGVPEFLSWLKSQGIPCAVVSNAKRRELIRGLELCGIAHFFETIISRDDCSAAKPSPLPYLTGAACLDLEPAECLAVEDSPTGIESSLLAGIPSAAVMTHFSSEALRSPVPGRPDLRPVWVGKSIEALARDFQHAKA